MRISDWRSDVCSSDLQYHAAHQTRSPEDRLQHSGSLSGLQPWPDDTLQSHFGWSPSCCSGRRSHDHFRRGAPCADRGRGMSYVSLKAKPRRAGRGFAQSTWRLVAFPLYRIGLAGRSEENTSELQSLMRNSYAVFGLKKKT